MWHVLVEHLQSNNRYPYQEGQSYNSFAESISMDSDCDGISTPRRSQRLMKLSTPRQSESPSPGEVRAKTPKRSLLPTLSEVILLYMSVL